MAIYRGPGGAGDATTDSSTEAAAAINAAAQAATSATNAESSATQAANSATAASSSASSASTSASTATTQANNAASSASAASVSALAASTSATNAAASASTATTQANNASTSATSASTSASTAQTAATLATSKATDASNAASVATTKASQASTSATNAATSETNAAASASSASTSASTATTQASNAATSATAAAASASTATTKASEASTSATNAATSATNAANSATAAATSATNSANSATSSAGSASSAAAAQIAAETARDQTLAAYDNFDDRYLGTKASDPTLDNDGNALVAGALYFNSTDGSMKVYDGSVWLAAYASLSGALLAANNLSDVASASSARTNLGLGTAATTASTDYATAAQGTKADTAYGWGNHASVGYLLSSTAASTYQPLDADLTSIAGLSGTSGLLKKTAANTWSLDTTSYVSDTSLATTLDAYVLADNALAYYAPQAAPTFTGNVTLSSGTANGVAYLNGSKVLTTGSALSFDGTNFSTTGIITVGATGGTANIFAKSGTGNLNIRNTNSGTNINIDFNNAATFRTHDGTTASEQMRLTSTGLGIGTSSPGVNLDIVGTTNNSNGQLRLSTSSSFGTRMTFVNTATNGRTWQIGSNFAVGNGEFAFVDSTAGATRMLLDSSGNLGLGVTPSAWYGSNKAFQIGSTGALSNFTSGANIQTFLSNNVYWNAAGTVSYITTNTATSYTQDNGTHKFYVAPSGTAGNAISFTQAMTLDASGNLGVGTSTISDTSGFSRALDLNGSSGAAFYARNAGSTTNYAAFGVYATTGYIINNSPGPLLFLNNGSERMRIDSGGNVGIGTSSPGLFGKLVVFDTTNNRLNTVVRNESSGSSASSGIALAAYGNTWGIECGSNAKNGNALTFQLDYGGTNSEKMRIDSSGNVGIGTSSPGYKLTVEGYIATRSGNGITFLNPSNNYTADIYNGAASGTSDLRFNTGGSERMRIDSSGNVGIGTSSPTGRLTVQDATNGDGTIRYGSNSTYYGELKLIYASDEFRIGAYGSLQKMTFYTAGSERMRIDYSGNFQTYCQGTSPGMKPAYDCRAWVNFNGTGTVAIRASGNVSSITDNGTGYYTVNYTNALPDGNYSPQVTPSNDATIQTFACILASGDVTTTYTKFQTSDHTGTLRDVGTCAVAVFR